MSPYIIGKMANEALIRVSYTFRGQTTRLVSARKAQAWEKATYEKQ
jgi:uncharacterized DUF497 family protein